MALLQIVCQNCGAKYRLPETFSGDRAKCKACGSVIDVAAQRPSAAGSAEKPAAKPAQARPAAAKPAAARPASARASASKPSSGRAAAGKSAGARAGSTKRAGARAAEDDDAPERGSRAGSRGGSRGGSRRGAGASGRRSERAAEPAKNNNALLIGVGAVVVIAVVAFLMTMGGDDENKQGTGNQSKPDQTASGASGDRKPDSNTPAESAPDAGAGEPATGETAGAPDSGTTPPDAGDPDPSTTDPATGTDPEPAETIEEPFDPRTELEPLEWPESITAEQRAEAEAWVEDVEYGGFAGINAKKKLEANYWVGTFAVLNKLRTLDLADSSAVRYGDELTRHFEKQMVAGIVVPWKNVDPSETPSNADRDRNGRNISALFSWARRAMTGSDPYLATEEAFKAWVEKKREAKSAGENRD